MLDIGWPEIFLIAVVVLLVVGPKELPKVLRNVGLWVSKAKTVTREFRTHVDDMIRESELDEVRDQINTAGNMDLESITENTIGHQDEVKDLLEYDMEEQAGDIPDDQTSLTESEMDANEHPESINNVVGDTSESTNQSVNSEKRAAS